MSVLAAALAAGAGACSPTADSVAVNEGGAGTGWGPPPDDAGSHDDAARDVRATPDLGGADAGAGGPGAPSVHPDAGGFPEAGAANDSSSHPSAYEAESGTLFGQARSVACPACSGAAAVTFAPDSGFTLSGVWAPATGTNALVIRYVNAGSTSRSLYLGINGTVSQMLMATFPPTSGAVASVSVPLGGFKAGPNNMLTFFIDTELLAPDLDSISLERTTITSTTGNACERGSWIATASVTGGGAAAAIDGNLKTGWASNRAQDGTDWFQVDFGALVKLPKLTLDDSQCSPDDYPGSYAVYASLDGVTFESMPFVTGAGASTKTTISFPQRTVRAIRINQVGAARAPHGWEIGELQAVCYQ